MICKYGISQFVWYITCFCGISHIRTFQMTFSPLFCTISPHPLTFSPHPPSFLATVLCSLVSENLVYLGTVAHNVLTFKISGASLCLASVENCNCWLIVTERGARETKWPRRISETYACSGPGVSFRVASGPGSKTQNSTLVGLDIQQQRRA